MVIRDEINFWIDKKYQEERLGWKSWINVISYTTILAGLAWTIPFGAIKSGQINIIGFSVIAVGAIIGLLGEVLKPEKIKIEKINVNENVSDELLLILAESRLLTLDEKQKISLILKDQRRITFSDLYKIDDSLNRKENLRGIGFQKMSSFT